MKTPQTIGEFMGTLLETAKEMNAGHLQVDMKRCRKFGGASFIFIACTDDESYDFVREHLSKMDDEDTETILR